MLDLSVRHHGMPEQCLRCQPLPEQFDARQEALWAHALALFVDQSGVDTAGMTRADLVPMVKSWGLAASVARMDRVLLLLDPAAADRHAHPVDRFALGLMLVILVVLLLACADIGRYFW